MKDEEFEDSARQMTPGVRAVQGTRQIHQINSVCPGVIHIDMTQLFLQMAQWWYKTVSTLQAKDSYFSECACC